MQTLNIEIVNTSADAPNYRAGDTINGHRPTGVALRKALIIRHGMESGRPTVDLQFDTINDEGEVVGSAVALVSGALLVQLAGAITGASMRG